MHILILSHHDVRQALPMREAVGAMKRAFAQLSTGQAEVPLRVPVHVPRHNGLTFFMPAYLAGDDQMAVKIVSVFNDNPARGLPLIHALVVVIDARTGAPVAAIEGASLTALRTGAASGAATDLLARPDAAVAAVFGAGVQGRDPTGGRLRGAADPGSLGLRHRPAAGAGVCPGDGRAVGNTGPVAASPAEAVRQADVVCTATTSTTPVFGDADLRPGAHINAVGVHPQMREVPTETVLRARRH